MSLLLVFSVVLVAAVLLSGLAHRSVLSTAVLFLVAGFLVGPGVLGWVDVEASDPLVLHLATFALFAVLFTDGMQATVGKLRRAWRLPGRALVFGLPLTFLLGMLAAHFLLGLSWMEAALVSAVLAPTDPVFASAIVGRREVPERLRHLLNVESGLNDGLALPVVVVLLDLMTREHVSVTHIVLELLGGVAIGVVVPFVVVKAEGSRLFGAVERYQPLNALGMGLLVFALCSVTHTNPFLGAFAAGVTVGSLSPSAAASFEHLGESVSEILKLAALLVFGALLSPALFVGFPLEGWMLVVVLLVVVRPLALAAALVGTRLPRREFVAAAWFGPKGFASVTYGLLVLAAGVPHAHFLFVVAALTIAVSIVAHSSTDVLVARWFVVEEAEQVDGSPVIADRAPEAAL